jgi:hypothetical protein
MVIGNWELGNEVTGTKPKAADSQQPTANSQQPTANNESLL